MLLCKYFVFIHFPRAGGTFIRETLKKHISDDWGMVVNPGHATVLDIPDQYRAIPKFGLIRNPWDWYVSFYSWWRAMSVIDPKSLEGHILGIANENTDNDFRTYILNLMDNPTLVNLNIGPLTWVYMMIYGLTPETLFENPENAKIKKFEELRKELLEILESTNAPISEILRQEILKNPPMNNFKRTAYQDYYDDELREIVAHRDRVIIDKYGYSYE